ncbi:MAG: hypothetical protein GC203_06185 [Phenylobacterium sp.]|uniref:hypothetical protein n=1 Tax=Phenylobacterium sp. TaxID=1871053 RepID=UPI0025E1AEE7|nr:hypothetical protein [Phenylobacterium sp.]MBI1197434.1 hypothetical protein [Phenylobacterium sp.]
MSDQVKTAGTAALVGAAAGAGLALGFGLRLFSALAMAALGTGLALGMLTAVDNDKSEPEQGDLPLDLA